MQAGKTLALAGTGLPAGATLQVVLHSDPVVVGTLTVGADGTATGSVVIPADAAVGAHTLDLVDASGTSVLVSPLAITVTAAPSQGGSTGGTGTASGTGATGTVPAGVHLPVVSG